jgi:hypothetical protein
MRVNRRLALILVSAMLAVPTLMLSGGAADAASSTLPPGSCKPIIDFNRANFGASTTIDNRFLPFKPGTQLTFEGHANSSGEPLQHTVVFTVTDVIKRIDGVYTLVIWDRDFDQGRLAEEELAFFAQDRAGNVWNLGEYPETFGENGTFTGAPDTWFAGTDGALPGIHMLANPALGTPRYLQGFSPDIDFLDCAQVFARNQTVTVPVQRFTGVLVTDETSPLADASAHQRKFHAPGVGIVEITAVDDPEGETLVLSKLRHLGAQEMTAARDAALRLDRRGYRNSPVYRHTQAAFRCLDFGPAVKFLPPAFVGLACP